MVGIRKQLSAIVATAIISTFAVTSATSQTLDNSGDCNANLVGSSGNTVTVICKDSRVKRFEASIVFSCKPFDNIQKNTRVRKLEIRSNRRVTDRDRNEAKRELAQILSAAKLGDISKIAKTKGALFIDDRGNSYRKLRSGDFLSLAVRSEDTIAQHKAALAQFQYGINSVQTLTFELGDGRDVFKGKVPGMKMSALALSSYIGFAGRLSFKGWMEIELSDGQGSSIEAITELTLDAYQCEPYHG